MTERVDFYVLNSTAPRMRWSFACRLAEKAYLRNMRIVIWVRDDAELHGLDDLLWTFSERSFVPHAIATPEQAPEADTPVHLTAALDPESGTGADLLVNLCDRMPAQPGRFARIAEIIDADDERRRVGRERFKSYREMRIPLETHQVDDGAEAQPAP